MGGETRRSVLRALAGAAVLTTGVEKASAIQTYTTPRPFVADVDKYKVRRGDEWRASLAFEGRGGAGPKQCTVQLRVHDGRVVMAHAALVWLGMDRDRAREGNKGVFEAAACIHAGSSQTVSTPKSRSTPPTHACGLLTLSVRRSSETPHRTAPAACWARGR
jgi:hypothetical protein